ncbi:MAG: Fe-S protein assembly co-chaperone HscB [Rugosibacter sp.]
MSELDSRLDANFSADNFALLGLPRMQGMDTAELDRRFRQLQAEVHPDRHVQADDAQRRLAMQWSTRVNEAYQILKSPGPRALYLLTLLGHDPQVESNTAMPAEFLMRQMELRETVMEARVAGDEDALDAARTQLLREITAEYQRLIELMDVQHDFNAAAELVRKLMFQEKLLREIDDAIEAVTA